MITRYTPPYRSEAPPEWRGACAAVAGGGPNRATAIVVARLVFTISAEGLLLQPRGEGELIELSDDEAVAAAVMLPMVAADRLAPSASSHTGGAFKRNVRGIV